jgi:uncharacterized protein DUF4154
MSGAIVTPGRAHAQTRRRPRPPRTRLFGLAPIAGAAIAVLLLTPIPASTQDVTEPALKAAFIYNFAKFTDWPAGVVPATEPLVMCVLGDDAVSDALARTVRNREIAGRKMTVSRLPPKGSHGTCHILYVSGVTSSEAAHSVEGLADTPVLTLSDVEGFTKLGGIAEFFFERGQLRFDVYFPAVKRARLHIGSGLLALARKRR